MTRLVIVGNGMVGSRFAEDLLDADVAGRFEVTVLGAESSPAYNRVLLSDVVAGSRHVNDIVFRESTDARLRVHRGVAAADIDREDRAVLDADGTRHRYDLLVLATGSAARIPDLPSLRTVVAGRGLPPGMHPLRTIDDARSIVAATLNATRAVVLGGGVLGLEVAAGLAKRGLDVTVVHPRRAVMERQLDAAASAVVEAVMSDIGIRHRIGVEAEDVVMVDGRVRGVRLHDGEVHDCDLLVVAAGTAPNVDLARSGGLPVGRGVRVDDELRTLGDRRIFAIGDCAEPPEGSTGLVAQGWGQSRALATALAGGIPAPRRAAVEDVVRLKAPGLDVVAMGVCGSRRDPSPTHRVVQLSDPSIGRHVELVIADGLLVGATCVGAGSVAADLVSTYTRSIPVPADPALLLTATLAGGVTIAATDGLPGAVCRCNSVTRERISEVVAAGAESVADVAAATRATTGCGGCLDEVSELVDSICAKRTLTSAKPSSHTPATNSSYSR